MIILIAKYTLRYCNTVYVDNVVLTVHLYIRKKTKPFTDGVENNGYTVHMFGLRTLYSTQSAMKIKTYLPDNPVKDALLILLVDNLIALDRRLV